MIVLRGVKERVDFLEFSPDGRGLAAPTYPQVQLWRNLTSGSEPTVLPHGQINALRFTPDGAKMLLVGSHPGVWDLATNKEVHVPLANLSWAGYCELTPDGRSLVFTQVQHRQQGGQILLSRRSISDLGRTEWSVELSDSPLSQPLFLAGGERFLLFGSWFDMHPFRSGPVYETRDPRTGAVVSEVRLEGEQYHHPVLSADRRRIAARRTKHIAVFHADDLSVPPVVLHNDNRKEYTGLAFHPSGRYLAATSNDSTVKFYDTSTWQMMHAFDWDIGRLRSIAFSPDGMLAAAGGDKGKIVIWDVDV